MNNTTLPAMDAETKAAYVKVIKCPACGDDFIKKSNNNRFCSNRCVTVFHNNKVKMNVSNICNLENEVWIEIDSFPTNFISNLGRVKSKLRRGNFIDNTEIERVLQTNKNGYSVIKLANSLEAKSYNKLCTVHRLVANAFIPNPERKPQINHINGIKSDNRVENLEWVTGGENQKHRFSKLGHSIHNRKLTKEAVFDVIINQGLNNRLYFADKYGVTIACIKLVKSGINYSEWVKEAKVYKSGQYSVEDLCAMGVLKLKEQ